MNHIGNLYPQSSQHPHYVHESPVNSSSNKSKQVFSPHILQHQNHSQLIHQKQQTMKLPITPCTGTNSVPGYVTQQQQHFPKSSSSKNNLNTTWKNESSEIAISKSTTTTTNNSSFIQAHQLLPSGLNNNNNNNFHHIFLENNKNQLHNHHHHLSQKKGEWMKIYIRIFRRREREKYSIFLFLKIKRSYFFLSTSSLLPKK